jgi:nucleoside-diphosphate-sugar epimerase
MHGLVIGGTGLISMAVVKHLLARNADVTVFNRGKRTSSAQVKTLVGDRNDAEGFTRAMSDQLFDVVIDMICFNPTQAAAVIQVSAGRRPPDSESLVLACEKQFFQAHADGHFKTTFIRPSHTYGPGEGLLDNLHFDSVAWDRIERGQPVLCSGDGLGLWVSTHRDDCAKLFAYAALNPKTFGQAYNATRAQHLTWRDYYREVAGSLGRKARLIFMPAQWIVAQDRKRFAPMLEMISAFHNAYDSSKAARDVPEFKCKIGLGEGVLEVFADQRRRGVWKDSVADTKYAAMVEATKSFGVEPVEA